MLTEKLIAEFCITFIFIFFSANKLKIEAKFSSLMKEKSLGEMESSTWFTLKIKQGIAGDDGSSQITVPAFPGSKNDLTNNGIFLFCKGFIVLGWITEAP